MAAKKEDKVFQKINNILSGAKKHHSLNQIVFSPRGQSPCTHQKICHIRCKCRLSNICALSILLSFIITCTPPPKPIIPECPGPQWTEYTAFQPEHIKSEIQHLESLLANGDTLTIKSGNSSDSTDSAIAKQLSHMEIAQRLFELSIHYANPDYNIDTIYKYALFLNTHNGPDNLRYRNWIRIAEEQKQMLQKRDSLMAVNSNAEEKNAKVSKQLWNEKSNFKKQCDSLNSIINKKEEMIMKLQQLDVIMEEQRSKIQ